MYARITNTKKLACEGKVYMEEHAQEEAIYQGECCARMEKVVCKEVDCAQGYRLCAIESCNRNLV